LKDAEKEIQKLTDLTAEDICEYFRYLA